MRLSPGAIPRGVASGKVLVLGEDTRSFLSVVRSLGRSGLEVHAAWCPLRSPSLRSRYLRAVHRLPSYRRESSDWLAALIRLLEEQRFDLVIPCHDSGLLPLQTHRAELGTRPGVYLLDEQVFDTCFSKARTYELAQRLGIPVPRQRIARNRVDLEEAAAALGFPLVLKPQASAGIGNPAARKMVRKVWNRAQLDDTILGGEAAEGILVQQNFIGVGVGVEILCRNGEILTAFQHERVHEPLMGGGSSYRRSVPLDVDLLEATRQLMGALGYTGVAMVEFKVNGPLRAWTLIEINCRFWGSLPLSIAAGVDFPRYLYDMLCLGRTEFPRQYRHGLFARNWLKDLRWMAVNLRADRTDPALMTRPLGQVVLELANPLLLRETSDTFTMDDPWPAIAEVRQAIRERVWPRVRGLWQSRRGQQKRAVEALRDARSVLFLCKGNICRSPFAEAALRSAGFDGDCASAGFYPEADRPAPALAVEAAARLGVDLRGSRSRVVEEAMLKAADVILIFGYDQRESIEALNPEALHKTHFLGALDRSGALEIADPYGCGAGTFERTYRRIQNIVQGPYFRAARSPSLHLALPAGDPPAS